MPIDVNLVLRRIDLLNNEGNKSVQEITQTGRLRVNVGDAFERGPDYLVKLIGQICVLKKYADAAALQQGEHMDADTWKAFFEQFDRGMHVLPSGKLM